MVEKNSWNVKSLFNVETEPGGGESLEVFISNTCEMSDVVFLERENYLTTNDEKKWEREPRLCHIFLFFIVSVDALEQTRSPRKLLIDGISTRETFSAAETLEFQLFKNRGKVRNVKSRIFQEKLYLLILFKVMMPTQTLLFWSIIHETKQYCMSSCLCRQKTA